MSTQFFGCQISPKLIQMFEKHDGKLVYEIWESGRLGDDFQELLSNKYVNVDGFQDDAEFIFKEAQESQRDYENDVPNSFEIDDVPACEVHVLLNADYLYPPEGLPAVEKVENLQVTNALDGTHKVSGTPSTYFTPDEVQEISSGLDRILEEDLELRWSKVKHLSDQGLEYSELLEEEIVILRDELAPFYKRCAQSGSGVWIHVI